MSVDNIQSFSLIEGLMKPEGFNPPVGQCILIETHISWVLIAEPYAYKIKKSLNLGFLDFSTLEKRLLFCKEELRLNKRLAPNIYLNIIPITGTIESPQWGGEGKPIEYAVKMLAFPQDSQLDRLLTSGLLHPKIIDVLAQHIANFHTQTDIAGLDSLYGEPEIILQPVQENFLQMREHIDNTLALQKLNTLEEWSNETFDSLQHIFTQRKKAGFIRECHGDMHLRNIAWFDDQPVLFDCLEFNPYLRWIDIISDVGFLVMDLQDRGQSQMAWRFLNKYLEYTGDYAAMGILRYYLVYRALVRAKIDVIRADQVGINHAEKIEAEKDFYQYLKLALGYIHPPKPQIIITHGMSASGKSTISQALLEHFGALRIRTDVERKRLNDLKPEDDGRSEIDGGIYSKVTTEKTYSILKELAGQIIDAGYSVIVDGVFLQYQQRQIFKNLAEKKHVSFTILECKADIETLRKRIIERKDPISDANLKVLEKQYSIWQPLHSDEGNATLIIDTQLPTDIQFLAKKIKERGYPPENK